LIDTTSDIDGVGLQPEKQLGFLYKTKHKIEERQLESVNIETFQRVRRFVIALCRRSNIFDNMLAIMEKYTNTLESLVDERTTQLAEEKKKTEALLLRMLPRWAAVF